MSCSLQAAGVYGVCTLLMHTGLEELYEDSQMHRTLCWLCARWLPFMPASSLTLSTTLPGNPYHPQPLRLRQIKALTQSHHTASKSRKNRIQILTRNTCLTSPALPGLSPSSGLMSSLLLSAPLDHLLHLC